MGAFWDMLVEIKDTFVDLGEELVEIATDDTDYDLEFYNAKTQYDKAVKRYNSYAGKYRYRCSAIKKLASEIKELCNQISSKAEVLKQFLKDENALSFLSEEEKNYLSNYTVYTSPIKNLNSIKQCIPNYNKEAKEWNTSLEVDQDDVISFLIAGPLGIVLNRAPEGYSWGDIYEVEQATEEVVKQLKNLQKKVTRISRIKSELEIKQKICSLILDKTKWYEENLTKKRS